MAPLALALEARATRVAVLWRFGRPHTLVGTVVGVLGLFALALQGSGATAGAAGFHLALTLVAALSVNVFIVGINQIEDVEIDRINKPSLPIAAGLMDEGEAWRVVALTGLVPLLLAASQGAVELVAVSVALFVGWAYSCPPVRLKRFPLAAAAAITLVRAGVVNLGVWWHFSVALRGEEAIHPAVWVLLGLTVPFAFAIAVLKDVPDLEGDRQHGISTFTVRLGPRRALALGGAALQLAAVGCVVAAAVLLDTGAALVLSALVAAGIGWLVARTPRGPEIEPAQVVPYYRDVWRLFFCAYVAVPAAFLLG